ncbi:MAG: hypothetical protein ABI559_04100 [Chloroflexota bacterium]
MRSIVLAALVLSIGALGLLATGAQAVPNVNSANVLNRNGSLAYADGVSSNVGLMHVDGSERKTFLPGHDPAWSPDGKQVAYVDGLQVGLANADGSNDHLVTLGKDPAWTPNGDLLVSSLGDIFSIPGGSGTPVNLTNTPGVDESEPAASPDGLYVAFSSNQDVNDPSTPLAQTDFNLWLMNTVDYVSGQYLFEESNPGEYGGHPTWSPDSKQIAWITGGDLWVVASNGNSQTDITQNDDAVQGAPAWSPDGTVIAYGESALGTKPDGSVPSQIWTIDPYSRARKNLTNNANAHDTDPAWQAWHIQNGPLTFVNNTNFQPEIDLIYADGTHLQPLGGRFLPSGSSPRLADLQWSPNGEALAAISGSGDSNLLEVIGSDGNFNLNYLFDTNNPQSMSWFPDSQQIAFENLDSNTNDHDIYTDIHGQDEVDITNTTTVNEFQPVVSPDGRTIAFLSDQVPLSDPPVQGSNIGIWTMDFDGLNPQFLTSFSTSDGVTGFFGHELSWSPDGKFLAYTKDLDVWTIQSDGQNATDLTNDSLVQPNVAWSPDGSLIAFTQGTLVSSFDIWTIDPNGGHRQRVSSNIDSAGLLTWQPIFAPLSDTYFVWGDNGCDGRPSLDSVLDTLKSIAHLPAEYVPGCPTVGESGVTSTNASALWGDTDCSDHLDAADVIGFFDYWLDIGPYAPVPSEPSGSSGPSCLAIGTYSQWIATG